MQTLIQILLLRLNGLCMHLLRNLVTYHRHQTIALHMLTRWLILGRLWLTESRLMEFLIHRGGYRVLLSHGCMLVLSRAGRLLRLEVLTVVWLRLALISGLIVALARCSHEIINLRSSSLRDPCCTTHTRSSVSPSSRLIIRWVYTAL